MLVAPFLNKIQIWSYFIPVDPNPRFPLSDSDSLSTSKKLAVITGAITP
jgi:hypothetical protein